MKKRVLILCTGNSARSQMAEALVNTRCGDHWEAFSAGTDPAAQVNPYALRALDEIGISASEAYPKPATSFSGEPFDMVLTVCDGAAEHCPMWPGQGERVHIGFPDPAQVTGDDQTVMSAFRSVRDGMEAQILPLLSSYIGGDVW